MQSRTKIGPLSQAPSPRLALVLRKPGDHCNPAPHCQVSPPRTTTPHVETERSPNLAVTTGVGRKRDQNRSGPVQGLRGRIDWVRMRRMAGRAVVRVPRVRVAGDRALEWGFRFGWGCVGFPRQVWPTACHTLPASCCSCRTSALLLLQLQRGCRHLSDLQLQLSGHLSWPQFSWLHGGRGRAAGQA